MGDEHSQNRIAVRAWGTGYGGVVGADPAWQRFVEELTGHRSDEAAQSMRRCFKTGPGGYGEGDVFLGSDPAKLATSPDMARHRGARTVVGV
jgi:hypothetical protein